MLTIQIKNRDEIENMIFNPRTALISITDYDWSFAKLRNQPEHLLQLAFDDISVDELEYLSAEEMKKYHMLTDEQAREIVEFYHSIHDKVDTLICQCEHGQSRSAAIASAILEYRDGKGIDIFIDDRYYPNKTIFKKVFKQLGGINK